MNIHLICVGKLKERFYADAAAEYEKRLGAFCRLQILELPEEKLPRTPSAAQVSAALQKEAARIRVKLPSHAATVALCVEGQLYSSEKLAAWMDSQQNGKPLVFFIGGSCGLDAALKREASVRLSMSPMTFPHHLARVMLLEQIYRAFQIIQGSHYHK